MSFTGTSMFIWQSSALSSGLRVKNSGFHTRTMPSSVAITMTARPLLSVIVPTALPGTAPVRRVPAGNVRGARARTIPSEVATSTRTLPLSSGMARTACARPARPVRGELAGQASVRQAPDPHELAGVEGHRNGRASPGVGGTDGAGPHPAFQVADELSGTQIPQRDVIGVRDGQPYRRAVVERHADDPVRGHR